MNVTSTLSFAFKRYRHSMAVVLLLSLLASAMGIGVLAYINTRLLQADAGFVHAIWWFVLLLVLYLVDPEQFSKAALARALLPY